jgi:hypothetical protein
VATPRYHHVFAWWCEKELSPDKRHFGTLHHWGYIQHEKIDVKPGMLQSRSGSRMILVQTLRHRDGRLRCFLINGDEGDTTTERGQQQQARHWLQESGAPCLVVPFRALHTAGIDPLTIVPIEITADRNEEIIHTAPGFDKEDIIWKPVGRSSYFSVGRLPGRTDLTFHRADRRAEWMDVNGRSKYVAVDIPLHERGMTIRLRRWSASIQPDGTVSATEFRHRLGDAVFSAQLRGEKTRRKFVSSFDYQERWPLYFLAELPSKARVKTVDDAILALAPPIVHAAHAQQRDVKRQGDMFAIPTELTTKEVKLLTGGTIRRMQGIFGTDHIVTESFVGQNRVTYGRGVIHHRPEGRPPDHRNVHLDKVWHLMVPNTVPRRRGATAQANTQTPAF